MAEEKPKAVQCPNCQGPAIRDGNKITCEGCDAVYTITKTEGARVSQVGPIQDLRDRIEKIESTIFPESPEPEEQPAGGEDEPEPENPSADPDQENSEEPFITG